ncbi:TIGR01459 family HAD-type hydrolase [Bosea sp. RAF48]|uniref:TIGR01459 family HAD-type hydrolase n=1 Tax=Bosea sp. RAF48 TaxID=3237480 RepID=UPI003F93AB93
MSAPALSEPQAQTVLLAGLAEVAERYDGFLLDQWGVLHDGSKPYPHAVACLEHLRAAGKAVVILSNSGRSGSENEAVLASMGFARRLYDHVASAGDDARDALASRSEPAYRNLGSRCLLLARPGEEHLANGLGLTLVESPEEADFLFAMTMDAERQSVSGWKPLLVRALQRGLPMICSNPDRHRVHADGSLREAPGLVALAYETMGGTVHYHGKPHPRIYASCLRSTALPASRLLAIGDSLEHDVAGAANAGIDACFIAGGIHKDDLSWSKETELEADSCEALFAQAAFRPRYCLAGFAW